jgi:hypothetical protein
VCVFAKVVTTAVHANLAAHPALSTASCVPAAAVEHAQGRRVSATSGTMDQPAMTCALEAQRRLAMDEAIVAHLGSAPATALHSELPATRRALVGLRFRAACKARALPLARACVTQTRSSASTQVLIAVFALAPIPDPSATSRALRSQEPWLVRHVCAVPGSLVPTAASHVRWHQATTTTLEVFAINMAPA